MEQEANGQDGKSDPEMTCTVPILRVFAAGLVLLPAGRALTPAAAQRASELYQKHDWAGLEALARPAAERDPKDGWAWYYSGLANDGLGHKSAAATAYQNALPYIPPYLQNSAAQLLALDYVALKENDKIAPLIRSLEKTNPQVAQGLRSQFPSTPPPSAPATLPEVSPRTLRDVTDKTRRSWKSDAIPVRIDVDSVDRGLRVSYEFYSPSARAGLASVWIGNNEIASPVANLQGWNTVGLPAQFLPLAGAVARTPAAQRGIGSAHLILENGATPATGLSWWIVLKNSNGEAIDIAAYEMPKSEFDALSAAAARGQAKAQYSLAMVYLRGADGPPDRGKAIEWLLKSAALGDSQAANKLGQFYQFGSGVQPNLNLAVSWYRKAAMAGFAPSQYNLGLMYERGLGVPRDYLIARRWIEQAAHQGLGNAISELPIVTAAANGQIRRAQQLQKRQASSGSGGCPGGYFKTPTGCKAIGVILTQPH